MKGHRIDDAYTGGAASVEASVVMESNGLSRRRILVGSGGDSSSQSPSLQLRKNNKVNCNGHIEQKKLHPYNISQRRQQLQKSTYIILAAIVAILLFIIMFVKHTYMDNEHLTPTSFLQCSSLLRSRSALQTQTRQQSTQQEQQINIILTASHLRHGSDGELRLRIIEHNLKLLLQSSSTNDNNQLQQQQPQQTFQNILIFSLDSNYENEIQSMVNRWYDQLHPSISSTLQQQSNNNSIVYVSNDAVLVDTYKWIKGLETTNILHETMHRSGSINAANVRIMLLNDSFLLTKPTPHLFNNYCGDVCGLAWTAPPTDTTSRHIQSYIRSYSYCGLMKYINFYYEMKDKVHNVNELIVLFEINLDWAKSGGRGSDGEDVSAMFEYVGAHPDEDDAQKVRKEVDLFILFCFNPSTQHIMQSTMRRIRQDINFTRISSNQIEKVLCYQ